MKNRRAFGEPYRQVGRWIDVADFSRRYKSNLITWMPTTELKPFEFNDEVASHALINSDDGTHVRVRPQGERWPAAKVKHILSGRQAMGFIIQSVSTRASEPPYRITQATKKLRSMRQSDFVGDAALAG
jgi:hypothetical protein